MFRRYHSFSSLRRLTRQPVFRLLFALLLLWDTLHILSIYRAQLYSLHPPTPPHNTKRIYIAAQHWNNAQLLRDRWNDALVTLVKELGINNVYVAIYESGSFDDTKGALRELDITLGELQVQRTITLSEVTHKDEMMKQPGDNGWIKIPSGDLALRRIPFLANLRNQVLQTLGTLSAQGHQFDTVLFLNDVIFTPEDVLRLLDTNGGEYAAACSLDFSQPPYFYDTFALRDSNGHEALMQTWPYFRSYKSRSAVEYSVPAPVASCWNGMVAMSAAPFVAQNPLRFRGIPDSLGQHHLEGSECCLVHADNPISTTKGIFLNPLVRVGYNTTSFDATQREFSKTSLGHVYKSIWKSRVLRWSTTPMFKEWAVRSRVQKWKKGHPDEDERAEICLINEMQIIFEKGWRHV